MASVQGWEDGPLPQTHVQGPTAQVPPRPGPRGTMGTWRYGAMGCGWKVLGMGGGAVLSGGSGLSLVGVPDACCVSLLVSCTCDAAPRIRLFLFP